MYLIVVLDVNVHVVVLGMRATIAAIKRAFVLQRGPAVSGASASWGRTITGRGGATSGRG